MAKMYNLIISAKLFIDEFYRNIYQRFFLLCFFILVEPLDFFFYPSQTIWEIFILDK